MAARAVQRACLAMHAAPHPCAQPDVSAREPSTSGCERDRRPALFRAQLIFPQASGEPPQCLASPWRTVPPNAAIRVILRRSRVFVRLVWPLH
jgi:hypothetical protein